MPYQLTLRESPRRHMLPTKPDFDVLLNGQKVGTAYFNMRGYRAGLPMPDGRTFDPGEVSLAQLRREVAILNKEGRDGFSICRVPYIEEADAAPRYSTLKEAETKARKLTEATGEAMNIVQRIGGVSTILAVTRRDALGKVWTDAMAEGAPLL